jgi:hypothetical protein
VRSDDENDVSDILVADVSACVGVSNEAPFGQDADTRCSAGGDLTVNRTPSRKAREIEAQILSILRGHERPVLSTAALAQQVETEDIFGPRTASTSDVYPVLLRLRRGGLVERIRAPGVGAASWRAL